MDEGARHFIDKKAKLLEPRTRSPTDFGVIARLPDTQKQVISLGRSFGGYAGLTLDIFDYLNTRHDVSTEPGQPHKPFRTGWRG